MIKAIKTTDLALSDIYRELEQMREDMSVLGGLVTPGATTTPPPSQSANQIRNGSYAHSVGSWDNNATADDRRYECAYWFSHPNVTNVAMQQWVTGDAGAQTFVDGNVTPATDNIAIATHGYRTPDAVQLTTSGVLPAGLALATTYYVIKVDANNIKLASSIANALAGTPVDITAAAGGGTHTVTPINYSLKSDDHASYSSAQSNWTRSDTPAGCARPNQGYSMDAPLAQPTGEPGYTMFAVFNCALANQFIYAPDDARITCGLYALQNGVWEYLRGAFKISASPSGTVSTPTEREYIVHARTARGFTIQSTPKVVASAPSDVDFAGGAVVVLSWPKPLQFGIIGYDIYRKTKKDFVDADVNTGTDTVTIADHTFSTGDPVRLTTTGVLPAGLALATTYYIIRVSSSTLRFASSPANATAGTPVDITGAAGGGTHTISSYKLLERVETGLTSYIDNNSALDTEVVAYPASDFTFLAPFTATSNGVVANLAVDGVDPSWDTLPFALKIPANYDHSLTDFNRSQWVRWALTGLNNDLFDIRVFGVTTLGAGHPGVFNSSTGYNFSAGLVGKTVTISGDGQVDHTSTVATYTDPTRIDLTVGCPWNAGITPNVVMVIEGAAGPNSMYVDLAHLSFGDNAIFSFHPDDLSPDRGIPPVAANGSNQGGTGPVIVIGPGPGDGEPVCPWVDEMVTVTDGAGSIFQKRAGDLKIGDYTIIKNRIGVVHDVEYKVADIWETETENGYKARTSLSHKYFVNSEDRRGRKLDRFKIGDPILTNINGRDVQTAIKSRKLIQKAGVVVEISLTNYREYLVGTGPGKWGGISSHNRKRDDQTLDFPVA